MPADPLTPQNLVGDGMGTPVPIVLPLHTAIDLYRALSWLRESLSARRAWSGRHDYLDQVIAKLAAALHEAGVDFKAIARLPDLETD